jgi:hypothetical protein
MSQHKATPDQWEHIEQFVKDCHYDACLLELRDRIAALEAAGNLQQQDEDADRAMADPAPAIAWARQLPVHDSCPPGGCDICQRDWPCARLLAEQDSRPTPNQRQIRSSAEGAPAGGLVERVECAMRDAPGDGYGWENEARAAILAVAEWLETQENGFMRSHTQTARWLREEVERG